MALRTLYGRDHLDQVLATFGLILFFNELVRSSGGRVASSWTSRRCSPGTSRSCRARPTRPIGSPIIGVGLAGRARPVLLITRTRIGMLIRAGATNREMVAALGVNIALLYTLVFGLGAALAGLAGLMAGPISSVQPGMGEHVLILTFVVIVIGGIGSIRGAFVGALIVGVVDTIGRAPAGCCAVAGLAAHGGWRSPRC